MRKNDNPVFALIPPAVLLKAKLLADEFRREAQLKDLAGRHLFSLSAVIILLALLNAANAFVFGTIATDFFVGAERWIVVLIWIYALMVCLGGMIVMFSALVAWLEVIAFRRANPLAELHREDMRFYRRSTWIPLLPLSLVPALFNALFSVGFFLAAVSLLLVLVMLFSLYSDA